MATSEQVDAFLNDVIDGLTSATIASRVGEYRDEYDAILENMEQDGSEHDPDEVFQGFVLHKIAALEAIVKRIVNTINEAFEEED